MAAPDISVVLATYNGATMVAETIDSLLAQSFTDFELIVVDDCSTDDTLQVLRSYNDPRLRLFVTPHNLGPVGARNQALGMARGRYIAAMDQDDISLPSRLAAQRAYLDAHPQVVALATAVRVLREGKTYPHRYPARTTPDLVWWLLHVVNPLIWSSIMLRGDAARALSPFERQEVLYAEDYDVYHRIARLGKIARLDEPLTLYRWHDQGASRLHELKMNASATKVLAAAYAPWFGPASHAYAEQMVIHVASAKPVPDVATLNRIAAIFVSVEKQFTATYAPDAATQPMIAAEMSVLWWGVARAAIRSGTISQAQVIANRPDFATPDGLSAKDLFRSGLIGNLRARRT